MARGLIFQREGGIPLEETHLSHQHSRVRGILKLPKDFVLHSLRHTFRTRLGEAGADAFTIMRVMGRSSVTVSQREVHPSPETVELAFSRLEELNRKQIEASRARVGAKVGAVTEDLVALAYQALCFQHSRVAEWHTHRT